MAYKYASSLLIVAAVSLLGLPHLWQLGQNYEVDKTSPNGLYRVRIEYRQEEGKGTRDYTERLKVQYLKGEEVILAYESENSDQYEPSIRIEKKEVEWVSENVLRMGDNLSKQPFYDEMIVSNNTDEYLKHIGISYGRFESFEAFDIAPRSQITLHASPRFRPDGSSNYFLGYSGLTERGKKIEGIRESKQRKSPADGPLKFQITINTSDLR